MLSTLFTTLWYFIVNKTISRQYHLEYGKEPFVWSKAKKYSDNSMLIVDNHKQKSEWWNVNNMRSVHFYGEWLSTFQKLCSKKMSRWWNARAEHRKENLEKKTFFEKLIENFQLTLIRVTINQSNLHQENFIVFIFWEWFFIF